MNRFFNAYSLYLLVTNYHSVRLSELMVGVLDNSLPTVPSILNAKLHIRMGTISNENPIPKKIRKFVFKPGCDTSENKIISINSKDAEEMESSLFPEDSAYSPIDEKGNMKENPYKLLQNSALGRDAPYQDFMMCPVQVMEYKIRAERQSYPRHHRVYQFGYIFLSEYTKSLDQF